MIPDMSQIYNLARAKMIIDSSGNGLSYREILWRWVIAIVV